MGATIALNYGKCRSNSFSPWKRPPPLIWVVVRRGIFTGSPKPYHLLLCCVMGGMRCVACGVWCVRCAVWHVVCGVCCVVCGMWRVVCGVWYVCFNVKLNVSTNIKQQFIIGA